VEFAWNLNEESYITFTTVLVVGCVLKRLVEQASDIFQLNVAFYFVMAGVMDVLLSSLVVKDILANVSLGVVKAEVLVLTVLGSETEIAFSWVEVA
jgi:hypothetical protein